MLLHPFLLRWMVQAELCFCLLLPAIEHNGAGCGAALVQLSLHLILNTGLLFSAFTCATFPGYHQE